MFFVTFIFFAFNMHQKFLKRDNQTNSTSMLEETIKLTKCIGFFVSDDPVTRYRVHRKSTLFLSSQLQIHVMSSVFNFFLGIL